MEKIQSIKIQTAINKIYQITIKKVMSRNRFSVEMDYTLFTPSIDYLTADDAVNAAVKAFGASFPGQIIVSLISVPVEEFISNERLRQLLI